MISIVLVGIKDVAVRMAVAGGNTRFAGDGDISICAATLISSVFRVMTTGEHPASLPIIMKVKTIIAILFMQPALSHCFPRSKPSLEFNSVFMESF
jgi:hypothetical protein